jgi:hypothetical protein
MFLLCFSERQYFLYCTHYLVLILHNPTVHTSGLTARVLTLQLQVRVHALGRPAVERALHEKLQVALGDGYMIV